LSTDQSLEPMSRRSDTTTMVTFADIAAFVAKASGESPAKITGTVDLCDLGVDGDDFSKMIEDFEAQFNVNMSQYLWYFHHQEEGFRSLRDLIFTPAIYRVQRIPVTPDLLVQSANAGCWSVVYPVHTLLQSSFDIRVDQWLRRGKYALSFVVLAFLLFVWFTSLKTG